MKIRLLLSTIALLAALNLRAEEPLRVAIAGMTHDHVHILLRDIDRTDIQVVGIWEPDTTLAYRLTANKGIDKKIIFTDLDQMLEQTRPEAVAGFGSIYDHLKITEAAAPRGIHVMVEKPLAVSVAHARKMKALAEKHGIVLMTNYETTWYATHKKAREMIDADQIGPLRKVIVYDGHKGPIGIRVSPGFEKWLTDPVLNGGGAVIDFGCYGANLLTWLMQGEKPAKVYADIRTHNPQVYPNVDDDATILVSYKDMEGVINGSWAWPFDRKDMHVYGKSGYIFADNARAMRYRTDERGKEISDTPEALAAPYDEAFRYLKAWVRGEITPGPYDLSSLENNMIVVQILEAAKKSAKTGRAVRLK